MSAALALTLLLGTVPALAVDADPVVTADVTVAGVPLVGMTGPQAHDAIAAACTTPALAALPVEASGKSFSLDLGTAVACDVDGMVAEALAATTTVELAPRWTAVRASVSAFIATVAKSVYRKPVDAKRKISKRRLMVVKDVSGRSVDTAAAIAAVSGAVTAEVAAGGAAQATVTVPVLAIRAKTTTSDLGKTIVVVLRERKVFLYKSAKLEKSYRCAIGQPRYPTPLGTWKIVRKVKNPSWHNNGAAWAKRMPLYIGPGRNNPLGTRALYLNASGIRIHGIPASENGSIGHAASHGCIRLKNSDAVNLFPRVPVGTPVYIVK